MAVTNPRSYLNIRIECTYEFRGYGRVEYTRCADSAAGARASAYVQSVHI